jgi:hypothetical protein
MGLFDFLKPKKNPMEDMMQKMHNSLFPKGQKDMDAATDELLQILNNKVSRNEASTILSKSIAISAISSNFTEERLRQHLAGYCLQHFSAAQVRRFYDYLGSIATARMSNRTPSEITRTATGYTW